MTLTDRIIKIGHYGHTIHYGHYNRIPDVRAGIIVMLLSLCNCPLTLYPYVEIKWIG